MDEMADVELDVTDTGTIWTGLNRLMTKRIKKKEFEAGITRNRF